MAVSRFGVSIEQELLEALDEYVEENKFSNRSQAIRQLVNRNLVEKKWQCNNLVAGSITLLYDQHKRELLNRISNTYEDYFDEILSAQRFMLSHEKCLEIIAVKGVAHKLTSLADRLISLKGIEHGKLTMTRAD
jgi:CopG family nickel-responsive transcriptional regulator